MHGNVPEKTTEVTIVLLNSYRFENHHIQMVMNEQSEGINVGDVTGMFESNPTRLSKPFWVKLDKQLNLYEADTFNGRIPNF